MMEIHLNGLKDMKNDKNIPYWISRLKNTPQWIRSHQGNSLVS